jgi:CRP/FNR family transcriptional regulator, cyclic AMP receptor protein
MDGARLLRGPRNMSTLNRPDKVWYLRQTGLFDRLGEAELRRIAELSRMHEFPRGQLILGPNSDPDLIYLVKTGRVKISTFSPEGKEQILALLERGDVFGELAPAMAPVPTQVEAFDHCIVCTLHRPLFEEILRHSPEVGVRVIRVLARRLRAAEQEIEDLALRNVPGRLAALLLRLGEEYGEPHDQGIRLSLRLTHQDVAHMVGSTRETVTTLINRFREEGLIAVDHRVLVILEPDRLRQIASPSAALHR